MAEGWHGAFSVFFAFLKRKYHIEFVFLLFILFLCKEGLGYGFENVLLSVSICVCYAGVQYVWIIELHHSFTCGFV